MMNLNPVCQVEAEQSLLGCCLIESVAPPISGDCFYRSSHRMIAEAMIDLELKGRKVDPVALMDYETEPMGGATYIAELMSMVPNSANLEVYASIVKEYSAARRAQVRAANFLIDLNNHNGTAPSEKIDLFCADILSIADTEEKTREVTARQSARIFVENLEKRMESPGLEGISVGFPEIDIATCGLCPQDILIIAARTSMGKTALALNMAEYVSQRGTKTLYFSLEMSEQRLTQRIMASMSGIALSKIKSGNLRPLEASDVLMAAAKFQDFELTIVDHRSNELDIVRKTRKHKPKLVIIDYLQLITPIKQTDNRNNDVGRICKTIKGLGKELNIPIILLAQLNRSNAKETRAPRLDDLRDSGEIEQDADMVLFVHEKNGDHTSENRQLILGKNRQGETGFWDMRFMRNMQRFVEFGPMG